jgi:hypothetical protein
VPGTIPTVFKRDPTTLRCTNEAWPHTAWVIDGEGTARRMLAGHLLQCTATGELVVLSDGEVTSQQVAEAMGSAVTLRVGFYTLAGPGISGNPEKYPSCILIKVDEAEELAHVPRDFDGLRDYMSRNFGRLSGVMFTHPDGRLASLTPADLDITH